MTTLKGPGIFLAQFMSDQPPFNSLSSICEWASSLGYTAVQIPTWDTRCIDLQKAAESKTYADEIKGIVATHGMQISELSTHLQGQLVAVHPAYDPSFDSFAPEPLRGNKAARTQWAVQQLKFGAKASANLGLTAHATFSGSLLWPMFHPCPQRPAGLVEEAFAELGKRWRPILDQFDECGVDLCYEVLYYSSWIICNTSIITTNESGPFMLRMLSLLPVESKALLEGTNPGPIEQGGIDLPEMAK